MLYFQGRWITRAHKVADTILNYDLDRLPHSGFDHDPPVATHLLVSGGGQRNKQQKRYKKNLSKPHRASFL
jgi:hypothetical protein